MATNGVGTQGRSHADCRAQPTPGSPEGLIKAPSGAKVQGLMGVSRSNASLHFRGFFPLLSDLPPVTNAFFTFPRFDTELLIS